MGTGSRSLLTVFILSVTLKPAHLSSEREVVGGRAKSYWRRTGEVEQDAGWHMRTCGGSQ